MGIRKDLKDNNGGLLPVLARYEVLDRARELELRDQALVSFLYLTGCRVEECCKYIKEYLPNRTLKPMDKELGKRVEVEAPQDRKFVGKPIQKKQIEFEDDVMIIRNVRILKRKQVLIRDIPILVWEKERAFINIIREYLRTIGDDTPLFDITRQRAYQILSSVGLFPHWLRHIRATHLVRDYGFNTEHLRQFTGWTDQRPAATYVHLNIKDLVQKMRTK